MKRETVKVSDLQPWSGLRRVCPASHERWVKSRGKIYPHGSTDGTANTIVQRESWFCHNYPMMMAHRGAYKLSDSLSVVFANDGYPDYNSAYMDKWFAENGINVLAKNVERGFTSVWLVESNDLAALDDAIWNAWKFRCWQDIEARDYVDLANLFQNIQKHIAYDTMQDLGLECRVPTERRQTPVRESLKYFHR